MRSIGGMVRVDLLACLVLANNCFRSAVAQWSRESVNSRVGFRNKEWSQRDSGIVAEGRKVKVA